MSELQNPPPPTAGNSAPDDIGELLQLAGHRPAVPTEAAARVKEAARAEWRRTVAANRQRTLVRRGTAAGALLAAAALLLLVVRTDFWRSAGPRPALTVATLEAATGPVIGPSGPLAQDASIRPGAVLETGNTARAALRLADGASLRMNVDTRLRMISATQMALETGNVYIDSGALDPQIEIRTIEGVVTDIGTRFEVRLDAGAESSLKVRVRDGQVRLDRQGEAFQASAGDELTVLSGRVLEGQVSSYDPVWDWIHEIPSKFGARGRPLSEFLDWAAREGGWTWHFSEAALAERATVTVGGGIDGLSLEESLDLVLQGAELRYRLDNGVLLLESLPPTP